MGKAIREANIVLALIAATAVFLMMLLVSADVTARYVARPIPGTLEITEFMMAFVIFFALAYALYKGVHVRVMVFTGRLPPRWQAACDYFALALALFIMALVVWASFNYFWGSYKAKATAMGLIDIPIYPFLITVPIGAGFFCLEATRQIVARMAGRRPGPAQEAGHTEEVEP